MTPEELVQRVVEAPTWDERVAIIRTIPEQFGTAIQPSIFGRLAKELYGPRLTPEFSHVHWTEEYELSTIEQAYSLAWELTGGFVAVSIADLEKTILAQPATLRVFRLIVALGPQEFAATSKLMFTSSSTKGVTAGRIKAIENGSHPTALEARSCALVVDGLMTGQFFGSSRGDLRVKTDRPDTQEGWTSVRQYANDGVPYATFLHQRHYGGAFRQLLDSTSSRRGNILEDAVQTLATQASIPFVRTTASNQIAIQKRFGLTIHPAPDFVFYDLSGNLRAVLECKLANDGGTARDKAARFVALRQEAVRLGGVPVVAVIAGLGWERTNDALGKVIQSTEGRTFALVSLDELLTVQPFAELARQTR